MARSHQRNPLTKDSPMSLNGRTHLAAAAACAVWLITTLVIASGSAQAEVQTSREAAPRPTYLPCAPDRSGEGELALIRRPSFCLTLTPETSFAEARDLRHLVWKHWGSSVATATGLSYAFHYGLDGKLPFMHVRIKASHLVTGACVGRPFYSQLTITSGHGTGHIRLSPLCADHDRATLSSAALRRCGSLHGYPIKANAKTSCSFAVRMMKAWDRDEDTRVQVYSPIDKRTVTMRCTNDRKTLTSSCRAGHGTLAAISVR